MEEQYFENAKVYIDDVLDIEGEVKVEEDGAVIIIGKLKGEKVLTHITKCVIKEL